jgi:hypothetical protein
VVDHVGAVGEGERHLGVLLHEQHAHPLALELVDGADHRLHHERGQPLRRLVEQEQVGARQHGPSDGEHLLLAAREEAPLAVQHVLKLGEAPQHVVELPAGGGPPHHLEILAGGEIREDPARLGHQGDAPAGDLVGGPAGEVGPFVQDRALLGGREARDGSERGGLAGAVAAEQRHYLALAHVQRQPVQDVGQPVVRVDSADVEDHSTAMPPR